MKQNIEVKSTVPIRKKIKNGNRIKKFTAHIPILIEKKNFIVKTANDRSEFYQALKLRHNIFHWELQQKTKRSGIDKDKFDKSCDHIIIIDKRSGSLIGTYRLQSSLHTRKWYTESEFHIKHIKMLPGVKLELGRACVHPEHRNGVTIALLWEGISHYVEACGADYLFGCSSIKTLDPLEIRNIYYYLLQKGHIVHDFQVRPRGKFKSPGLKRHLKRYPTSPHEFSDTDMKNKLPPLLKSYLKVGAVLLGTPALDRSFKCYDFFTLLELSNLKKERVRKPRD